MPINQLFKNMPDRSFVINLLNLYGITDFDDSRYFTRDNLETLNTVEKLNQFVNELNLGDVWRIFHPDKKRHTWRRGQLARRLDYIFTEENLLNFVEHTDIKNIGFSDHSCCIVTLSFSKFKRGPSYYKMNTELLKDIKYVNLIKKQIPIILNKHVNLNKQQRWEMYIL